MVELRLVGGDDRPPGGGDNPQVVAIAEEYLELARRGLIHSIAIVGLADDQLHVSAFGHDTSLCGGLEALKFQILDQALEPV